MSKIIWDSPSFNILIQCVIVYEYWITYLKILGWEQTDFWKRVCKSIIKVSHFEDKKTLSKFFF